MMLRIALGVAVLVTAGAALFHDESGEAGNVVNVDQALKEVLAQSKRLDEEYIPP